MKKIILSILLLAGTLSLFSQQTNRNQVYTSSDYLQKSKKQKKTGLILLGAGVVLVSTGFIIPEGELTDDFDWTCLCQDIHKNDGIKGSFLIVGVATMGGSIPFFLAAGKNKRRAKEASVFINMEKTRVLQGLSLSSRSFPVLGIKINL